MTNDSDSPLLAARSLCCPHSSEHCWLWPSLASRNWKVRVLLWTLLAFKYMTRSFSLYLLHERCERLFKVAFRRRDVDNHEGFGISTQRVLHHLREMKSKNTTYDYFHYQLTGCIYMINYHIV